MSYINQLEVILESTHWTQEEAARKLGVSFVAFNAWINNRAVPRKKAQQKIEKLYEDIIGTTEFSEAELATLKSTALQCKLSLTDFVNNTKSLNDFTLRFASNEIKFAGSSMTVNEVRDVLFADTIPGHMTQTELTILNNTRIALLWLLSYIQRPNFRIDQAFIKGLHARLLHGLALDAGEYSQHSLQADANSVTIALNHTVNDEMAELVNVINQPTDDPVAWLAQTHAMFIKISPFNIGNHRTARLLLVAQALLQNLTPPTLPKEKAEAYRKYLEAAQHNNDFSRLEHFLAEAVVGWRSAPSL